MHRLGRQTVGHRDPPPAPSRAPPLGDAGDSRSHGDKVEIETPERMKPARRSVALHRGLLADGPVSRAKLARPEQDVAGDRSWEHEKAIPSRRRALDR